MEWNIRNDYDPGDETIHFGTRAYAESDGCIYEITTVATFENENEISDTPSYSFGDIAHGAVCVCVENTLTVFANQSSSTMLFNMAFDSKIETFTCSPDGNFLLVGLNNGFIQFLHIPSEGEPVYAKKLQTQLNKGRMFVKIIVDGSSPGDVWVVCASGVVLNLYTFDFMALHAAVSSDNAAGLKELVSSICATQVCGNSGIAPINSVTTLKWREQLVVFAVGQGIATYSIGLGSVNTQVEAKWLECQTTSTLLKIHSTNDKGLFLALNAAGQLICVCPYTLRMKPVPWKNHKTIYDFQLAGNSTSEALIVGITASSEEGKSNLTMMTYSGLKEKFSLDVGQSSILMSTSCDIEDINFLEFGCDKESHTSTIALKTATQTVPKFRLDRLLVRKKFEAAESLAKNFGLDMTPIFIARAQNFLDKLQPWGQNKNQTPSDIKELLKCLLSELDQISDLDFVSNCCVSAVPPDYYTAHALLQYAQKRLELFFANNPELESKVSEWSSSVCGSILRLETLNLLKPSWNVEEWLDFSNADLLREVQTWIKQGALSEASVIWSRHELSFKTSLKDENIVHCLLEEIPPWVALDKILEWLAHLLPPLLKMQPSTLPQIVDWILLKISALERSHPREWPKIGLDYSEKTLKLMSSQKFATPFVGLEASPLRPLVVLRCNLADLYSLRSKYYIFITLEEFSQPPSEVAVLLLDYIDVSSISAFVTEYLNGYVLEHRLDGDTIISTYIKCVLQASGGWWKRDEAPWELRIASLIPHITNYKFRLECINSTLESAPVPWSPLITSLAEEGLKLKHPMSSLIREKQKQVKTNLILKKYDLKTHINKIDKKMLLSYVVKQNHPDMLNDLAELSQQSVDDYVTVVMHLFHMGNTSTALEVLQKLPNNLVVQICPCLVDQLCRSLDLYYVCNIEDGIEFISAVALCHETAKASNPPGLGHIEDLHLPKFLPLSLEEIKYRFILKRDFKKYLTSKEMSLSSCRLKALKEIISDLMIGVVENEKPKERITRLYYQSTRAARLLFVSPAVSLMELVERAIDVSDYELAAYIAGFFDDLNCLSGKLYKKLMELCSLFFMQVISLTGGEKDVQITQEASTAVYKTASKVCSHCNSEQLLEAVKTFGWAKVWFLVSGQQDSSLIGQRDPLLSWRFTPLYKDPGMSGFLSGSHLSEFLHSAYIFSHQEDVSQNFLSNLNNFTVKLQNDQHDVAIIMIFSQVLSSIKRYSAQIPNAISTMEASLLKSCEVLLSKTAGSRQLDKLLSLSLLTYMGQIRAFEYLQRMCRSTQVDFQRQMALSSLGTIVTSIWKTPDLHSHFKLMSVQSTWGVRLSELGISAKELLRGKSDTDVVLQKLIGSKSVNSSLLKTLCVDFQLDFQDVLLQHLCAILLSWDPDPIVTVNSDGTKDVIERNTQQQLLDQCWEIQKDIKNKNILCNTLASTWEKVNFYHHEVFIVILEILERHGVANEINKRLITTFLKKYRRVKAPDQAEEEFWTNVFPTSFGLPPMSEFRLPFTRRLIDTPQQVVRHEINLSTYKSWLSIASALDIPKDKICTIAVHQTVTEEFSGYQNNMEWCGTLKNEALFESIAACVAQMDDVVQAAATLYFFMNKIPAGLDQVAAANLCVQYAEIVFNQTGETEYKHKIEKKYYHLATLQTLHLFGLGQPCYLQLAQNPTELINALYQHPTILDLCKGIASHSLDINGAVEEISNFHRICLKTLHMNLVTEWLQPDIVVDCNRSLDDDCFGGMNFSKSRERDRIQSNFSDLSSADDNILRARYVMEHGDVQDWALFLISTVFKGEACIGMRLRALQCLCMLTDDETIEELAGRSMTIIREKLRTLAYLQDLEILGLTYSETGFESCDKKELANLILRTQNRSSRAVSLLVHLCVDYEIGHMSIWNSILQQLSELSMMKDLELALSHTSHMYQLWTVPAFSKAWNLLLTSPFSKANFNSDEEQESAMLNAVTLFPKCPIMKCIDVAYALETCLTNRRPEIAALLLPYVEKSSIPQWQEQILSCKKVSDLLGDVEKITGDRCINISKVLSLFSPEGSKEV